MGPSGSNISSCGKHLSAWGAARFGDRSTQKAINWSEAGRCLHMDTRRRSSILMNKTDEMNRRARCLGVWWSAPGPPCRVDAVAAAAATQTCHSLYRYGFKREGSSFYATPACCHGFCTSNTWRCRWGSGTRSSAEHQANKASI